MATLEQVVRDLNRNIGRLSERRGEAKEFRDSFEGDLEQFLQARPGETPEDFKQRPHVWLNLTRPFIRLLSGLYREEPERTFTPPDAETEAPEDGDTPPVESDDKPTDEWIERLEDVYAKRLQGALLSKCDAMTRLQGTAAIQPWYDRNAGRMKFFLWTADEMEVYSRPGLPDEAQFIVLFGKDGDRKWAEVWQAPDMDPLTGATVVGKVLRFEEDRRHPDAPARLMLVEERELVGDTGEPYRVLPFAFFHNDLAHDSFFAPGFGKSLCPGNWHVNQALTDLAYAMQYQSHGQWYVKNVDARFTPEVGPSKLIRLVGDNTDIGILAPMLAITEVRDYLDAFLDDLLSTHDLPKASYRLETAGAASGVSIIAEQQPLADERKQRGTIFAKWEENLAWVTLTVLSAEEGLAIPDDPDGMGFGIAFCEPTPQLYDDAWIARKTWEKEQGLVSRVDLFMDLHPRVSREQAIEQLQRVDEEEDQYGKPSSGIMLPPMGGPASEFGEAGGGKNASELLQQLQGGNEDGSSGG